MLSLIAAPFSQPITAVFTLIGFLFVFIKVFSFWRLLVSLFVLPGASLKEYAKKGTWAVVTGASDGIGKEYALQLAAEGYNVALVSRTQSKLDTLASQIESRYSSVQTKTLAMDFSLDRESDYEALKSLVSSIEVGILVNNVGLSHDMPVPFYQTPEKEMKDIIIINCLATLKVTRLITPGMVQRRKGLIITMASFGGIFPTPLLATYSGSKAFLQQWSTALGSELEPHDIQVQLVQSHLVTSAMSKIKRPSMIVPTPKAFVAAALGKIGRSGGAQGIAHTSTPYWSHGIGHWALATFVGTMNGLVVDRIGIMQAGVRKKALQKQARDSKKAA